MFQTNLQKKTPQSYEFIFAKFKLQINNNIGQFSHNQNCVLFDIDTACPQFWMKKIRLCFLFLYCNKKLHSEQTSKRNQVNLFASKKKGPAMVYLFEKAAL